MNLFPIELNTSGEFGISDCSAGSFPFLKDNFMHNHFMPFEQLGTNTEEILPIFGGGLVSKKKVFLAELAPPIQFCGLKGIMV